MTMPERDSAPLSLFRLIREDLRTQREGLLSQGFWALLVHRLAYPRMAARHGLPRKVWAVVNRLFIKLVEITGGIYIGESAQVGRRLVIEHFGGIIVHGRCVIGNDCMIRQGVTLGNRAEDDPEGAPTLEDGVVIGAGAVVLGRITIGQGAVIGANSVVLKDVPAWAIAVGTPARVVKFRPGKEGAIS